MQTQWRTVRLLLVLNIQNSMFPVNSAFLFWLSKWPKAQDYVYPYHAWNFQENEGEWKWRGYFLHKMLPMCYSNAFLQTTKCYSLPRSILSMILLQLILLFRIGSTLPKLYYFLFPFPVQSDFYESLMPMTNNVTLLCSLVSMIHSVVRCKT